MNTESFVLNFANPKDPSDITDYQNELAAVWLDHLEADNFPHFRRT